MSVVKMAAHGRRLASQWLRTLVFGAEGFEFTLHLPLELSIAFVLHKSCMPWHICRVIG